MSPLVSVLMPAYNAERWIVSSIESALSQTWPRVEVIVVDDGSKDGTLAAARSLRSPAVKVVRQDNAGPCAARNRALSLAQGDYIQYLDADDLLAPDKIERQLLRLRRDGTPLCIAAGPYGNFTDDPSRSRFVETSVWQDLSPVELFIRKLRDNAHVVLHAWLFTRRPVDEAGPWDLRLQRTDADGEYAVRVVGASEKVLFVPDARCYYRKGIAGSLSATRTDLEQEELLLTLLFGHLLALEDSPRTRQACVSWLQQWAASYYFVDRRTPQIVARVGAMLGRDEIPIPLPAKSRVAERLLGWSGARRSKMASLRARATLRRLAGA